MLYQAPRNESSIVIVAAVIFAVQRMFFLASFPRLLLFLTTTMKTVYLIRHAESEENERIASLKNIGSSIGRFRLPSSTDLGRSVQLLNIPAQVDTPLSAVGRQQVAWMGRKLRQDQFATELVVHSPLERAKETCWGMLGCCVGKESNCSARVFELESLSEKYPSEWLPGYATSFQKRIQSMEDWLHSQPEATVALVGHSQYFKAMLGLDFKFGNCEVWKVEFDGSRTESTEEGQEYKLPPRWSQLERVYKCNLAEDPDQQSVLD